MSNPITIHELSEWQAFAQGVLKAYPSGAIVGLSGELGAGKTTLVRELIRLIAEKSGQKVNRVMSPSFVLHQAYPQLNPPVDHFDLYRMNEVTETMLIDLEYYEIIDKARLAKGFVFVEWPEQCRELAILRLDAVIRIEIKGEFRQAEILNPPDFIRHR